MWLFKRFFKQMLLTALLGFVVHKLMTSDDPRMQAIGRRANRFTGGAFGPHPDDVIPTPSRKRRVARSAATAAAGGAVSYFFDPEHGYDRRAKVKRFASERMQRNGNQPLLPPATNGATSEPSQVFAPGVPS